MSYRYTCLNNISEIGLREFSPAMERVDEVGKADGILVRSAQLHDMEFSDKLLAIARAGAGVNNIPLEKAAEKGIVVFNTPGANANGVKELVIAGMLLASRDVIGGVSWVSSNAGNEEIAKNAEKEKKKFAGTEVAGKKLGIIGLGAIGVRVANCAKHLDMEVYGYDPYVSVDAAWHLSRDIKHVTDINDIFANCDIITIHVPLMDSTKGMINAEAISRMKDGVILINMARDLLCDEDAVLQAIDEGKIRKYVSDFPNSKVAGHPGCITTPHLGASTAESEDNCAIMAVKELEDYLVNGNIRNSVTYPSLNMGICTTAGRVAVMHKNIANMISQFSSVFGEVGINISEFQNKSKGDYAYTMMDLDTPATEELIGKLRSISGVYRVRIVK